MTRKSWPLLALFALLTGCLPVDSLNPLYTDKDVIFDEALLGDWKSLNSDDTSVISFSRYVSDAKPDSYSMAMIDEHGSKTEFQAHLLEIEGHRFMDIVPENWEARSESYALHLTTTAHATKIQPRLLRLGVAAYLEFSNPTSTGNASELHAQLRPAHWFFRVKSDGKKMRLDGIDDDDLRKAIEQGKIHIGNSILGEGKDKSLVLTAKTSDLQRFVLEHVDDDTVFSIQSDEIQLQPKE